TIEQDTLFVANVLSNCWTCSSALQEIAPCKIKAACEPEYGPEYVAQRIDEEHELHHSTITNEHAEDEDETMQDADHENVDDSSAPSTPTSHAFETPSPRSSITDPSTVSPSYSKPDSPPMRSRRRRSAQSGQPKEPLTCDEEGCSRTFSSQSNLNRHRISFHG